MNTTRRTFQLFGITLAVAWPLALAVGAFALTVTGQRQYMRDVARYGPGLAWVGPVVIEGTLVAALLALLLITLAGWSRLWVWATLVIASAASVVGNAYVATAEGLPTVAVVTRGSWPLWVILCETVAVIVVRELWPETVASLSTPATLSEVATDALDHGTVSELPHDWPLPEHSGEESWPGSSPLSRLHIVKGKPARGAGGKVTADLKEAVRAAVESGPLPARDQTALGKKHGVSRSTVRRVIRSLNEAQASEGEQ